MLLEAGDDGKVNSLPGPESGVRAALALLLPATMLLFTCLGSVAGATMSVSTPATAEEGSTFPIIVQVQSVTDLYGAQFDLSFDPAVLEVVSVTEGPFLKQGASTFWNPPAIDNVAGTLDDAAQTRLAIDTGVSGSGSLATISFRAKAMGTSSLSLGDITLVDSNAQTIGVTTQAGSVTVVSAPPPPEAPETRITSGPIGTIGISAATFTWTGSDPDGFVASYDYTMDSEAWTTTTATSKTFTGLSKGDHTFRVQARDDEGLLDPSPASRSFTVYFTANPETQILSGPSGIVEGDTATFTWTGSDPDGQVAYYLYSLDNQTWASTTETILTYGDLPYASHTFQVKAVDDEGLEDPTPAERVFTLTPYWWEEEMDRLNRTVRDLEEQLQASQGELEETKEELAEERARLGDQVESLQGEVEALQTENADLGSRNEELEVELDELREWSGELEANATDLARRLNRSEETNVALSQDMERLTGRLEDKEKELQQTTADLELSQADIVVLEAQVESLVNHTAWLQEQVWELRDGVDELETERQALEELARTAEEDRSALQEEVSRLQSGLSAAEQRAATAESQMSEKQLELESIEAEKRAQDLHLAAVKETNEVLVRTRQTLLVVLGAMSVLLLALAVKYRRA